MELNERLLLFQNMVSCCHNLYLWTYDSNFHLISSNCSDPATVDNLFTISRRNIPFSEQLVNPDAPILLNNELGMMWGILPLWEKGELIRLYVLGPFFMDDVSLQNMETALRKYNLAPSIKRAAREFLHKLPIISLNRIFEYLIMLHYCITEQKISISDIRYLDTEQRPKSKATLSEGADIHGTYEAEQEMLRMVREGDIHNYQAHMEKMSMTGHLGKLSNGDPLRQMKNAVLVCITLFSRAAIEGGLSPEVSYTLTDHYFQSVENCHTLSELAEISYPMQDDFIRRVHRCRTGKLSAPIQACCDYIELHLEDELSLPLLASQTGYTEYYLSKKFKKETGLPPSEYIRQERLKRAAFLLSTTKEDIYSISDRLLFCSQSYFADNFRKQYGMTPSEYREKKPQRS